jgi:hypothetical protein
LLLLGTEEDEKLDEVREASIAIDHVLKKEPENVEAIILKGRILIKLNQDPKSKNEDAVKQFELAI